MTMKPKIKTGWVEDLRSGKFPQTTGRLVGPAVIENPTVEQQEAWRDHPQHDGGPTKDPNVVGYCCLGVLTHRAIESGEIASLIRWAPGNEWEVEVWSNPDGEEPETPDEVNVDGEWIEFTDNDLPRCVSRWAGITDKRPGDHERLAQAVTERERREFAPQANNPRLGSERAIARNDNLHQSFAEIADAVEGDDLL